MNASLRNSGIRLISGGILLVLAVLVALVVLPDASQLKNQKQNASAEAKNALAAQKQKLADLVAEDGRLTRGRELLSTLLGKMSEQDVGKLQWQLSRRVYDLAQKNSVHLQSVKYGTPTREGAKGTDLEIVDVEFTASGIYQNLKAFMLGLEDTKREIKKEMKEDSKDSSKKTIKKDAKENAKKDVKEETKEDASESQLPFAVTSAKIEESPDGARLSVTLRAFRRAGAMAAGAGQEGI